MAHDGKFTVPPRPLGVADIRFTVRRNGGKFGELRISNGTVVWIPANKTFGRRLSWAQIDQLAQGNGTRHRPSVIATSPRGKHWRGPFGSWITGPS